MTRSAVTFTVLFGAAIVGLVTVQRPVPMPAPQPVAPTLTPYGTLRDIMADIVDPASMTLFDSVGIEVTNGVEVRIAPQTETAWNEVAQSALALAEAGNLLKMAGRPVANPEQMDGQESAPTALPPRAIEAKIASDPAAFAGFADAMSATALDVLAFVKARDTEGLSRAIEDVDGGCESCHKVFWYPDVR